MVPYRRFEALPWQNATEWAPGFRLQDRRRERGVQKIAGGANDVQGAHSFKESLIAEAAQHPWPDSAIYQDSHMNRMNAVSGVYSHVSFRVKQSSAMAMAFRYT